MDIDSNQNQNFEFLNFINESLTNLANRVENIQNNFQNITNFQNQKLNNILEKLNFYENSNRVKKSKFNICPRDYEFDLEWTAAPPGSELFRDCPNGLSGKISRRCSGNATWEPPDFSNCTSDFIANYINNNSYYDINDLISHISEILQNRNLVYGEIIQLLNLSNITKNYSENIKILDLLISEINGVEWSKIIKVLNFLL